MSDIEQELLAQRLAKVAQLRALGREPFGNGFVVTHLAAPILAEYGALPAEALAAAAPTVSVAGRVVFARSFGKAGFLKLQDRTGRIQIYCQKQTLSPEDFAVYELTDLGDIVHVEGHLFYTKTGELSVQAKHFTIATKAVRPPPEKFHGLTDVETRYRQRYADLMANQSTREQFICRGRLIAAMRNFFLAHDFLEVETPMMHVIPGGATARPFITHHNTLDMDLFLRVAPELYLKRLVVGGLERVFEMNRNFRNEGTSTQHNPEFTMIEWYEAYATFEDHMRMIESCIATMARDVLGTTDVTYQGTALSLGGSFTRVRMTDAMMQLGDVPREALLSAQAAAQFAEQHGITVKATDRSLGAYITAIFEARVEPLLVQPTFITHYPVEVSPLARRNSVEPEFTDRFELYICGREIANGFSELNDPQDQAQRFRAQADAKSKGDHEAMYYDADYIRALEYGMPPTAGSGIGVDRLVMILTDAPSIRDVILFPLLRNEGDRR